jgi:hypothetical protein
MIVMTNDKYQQLVDELEALRAVLDACMKVHPSLLPDTIDIALQDYRESQ